MTDSELKSRMSLPLRVALITASSWALAVGITAVVLLIVGRGSWALAMTIASVCALIISPVISYYVFKLYRRMEVSEQRLRESNARLEEALGRVHQLSGLLPICSSCKKIRNEDGGWDQLESYIETHSEADFTHSLCPQCHQEAMGQVALFKSEMKQRTGT